MSFLAIAIFAFCSWAIFSKHFRDGIVAKHCLSLSAITAAIVILDHHNFFAATVSVVLLFAGLVYSWYKHRHKVFTPYHH